jgi:hypothetical protein
VRAADGTFRGTVADLRAVVAAGALVGVYDAAGGTFRAAFGPSTPVQARRDAATGAVYLANGIVAGIVQGAPPPLAAVISTASKSSGGPVGWVAWATQEATAAADGASLGSVAPGASHKLPEGLVPTAAPGPPTPDLPSAVDASGGFLGYVLPNGSVVSSSAQPVGAVMPDGSVVGAGMAVLGAINAPPTATPGTAVLGFSGRVLGILQPDGRIVSPVDGSLQGLCTPSGRVISPTGHYVALLQVSTSLSDAASATPLASHAPGAVPAASAPRKSVSNGSKGTLGETLSGSSVSPVASTEALKATGRLNSAEKLRRVSGSRTGSGRSSSGRMHSRKTPKVRPCLKFLQMCVAFVTRSFGQTKPLAGSSLSRSCGEANGNCTGSGRSASSYMTLRTAPKLGWPRCVSFGRSLKSTLIFVDGTMCGLCPYESVLWSP